MGRYKNEFLARRIKELLQENFTKTKANDKYSELKKAFLDDEDFIDAISNAIQDDFDFDINELKKMFTTNEICSIIDADDAVNYIGDTELLDEMDNDTIADYLMNQNYDTIFKRQHINYRQIRQRQPMMLKSLFVMKLISKIQEIY